MGVGVLGMWGVGVLFRGARYLGVRRDVGVFGAWSGSFAGLKRIRAGILRGDMGVSSFLSGTPHMPPHFPMTKALELENGPMEPP